MVLAADMLETAGQPLSALVPLDRVADGHGAEEQGYEAESVPASLKEGVGKHMVVLRRRGDLSTAGLSGGERCRLIQLRNKTAMDKSI
jgi:hypothetical protein